MTIKVVRLSTDVAIVGGGAAGCFAAVTIKETGPETDVLVVEKAHIKRSGCLAAGVNAINAYLNPGETPESYLEYVKKDSAGLVRDDLVYSIGQRLNRVTEKLESWGLPFLKDESGRYKPRGKRNVQIIGENIKPVIAAAAERSGARILNRTVATNYIVKDGRIAGVFAFSTREKKFYVISAKAVICATGGAAGIYRPNNDGMTRHKMWYCPFNVGTGFAMGLRAGAEMTTFEMRFIALRINDVLSPTGTVAQGVRARQVNALGEEYQGRYGSCTTPMRMYATIEENRAGRGPCYLDLTHIPDGENLHLKEAYLSMSPGIVLKWADEGAEPNTMPLEICGSEPYIVGGHGQAGYWVDTGRRTTVRGLFAAGDVAGGSPKKYVTGCFAEGEMAAHSAMKYIKESGPVLCESEAAEPIVGSELNRVFGPLDKAGSAISEAAGRVGYPDAYEERLQKIMDEYAGGISANYEIYETKLIRARELLRILEKDISTIRARDVYELVKAHEVIDRVLVARALVEHLIYRKETRWRSYQERVDYPERDDRQWFKFINSFYNSETGEIKIKEQPWQDRAGTEGLVAWDGC